jgi:hypothetical protein
LSFPVAPGLLQRIFIAAIDTPVLEDASSIDVKS